MERLCACGCGEQTRPASHSSKRLGWRKGEPIPYVNGHNPRGKGTGWYFDKTKNRMYVIGRDGSRNAYYRIVAGNALGRKLRRGEVVHHINGDSSDDRLENLMVLHDGEHRALHQIGNVGRFNTFA